MKKYFMVIGLVLIVGVLAVSGCSKPFSYTEGRPLTVNVITDDQNQSDDEIIVPETPDRVQTYENYTNNSASDNNVSSANSSNITIVNNTDNITSITNDTNISIFNRTGNASNTSR